MWGSFHAGGGSSVDLSPLGSSSSLSAVRRAMNISKQKVRDETMKAPQLLAPRQLTVAGTEGMLTILRSQFCSVQLQSPNYLSSHLLN